MARKFRLLKADEGMSSRMIEKFGDVAALLDYRPCAFDEFGESEV